MDYSKTDLFKIDPSFIANNVKEEMFGFEFEGNQVRFNGEKLDPSIASWIFLMYERMKKKCSERNRADKANRNTQKQMKNVTKRTQEQRWYINWLLRKVANLEAQNKALIEYVKTHK